MTQLTTMTPAHLVIANIPDVTAGAVSDAGALVLAEASAADGAADSGVERVARDCAGGLCAIRPGRRKILPILMEQQKGPITDAGVFSAAEVVTVQAQVRRSTR